jgi:hypothetical protein
MNYRVKKEKKEGIKMEKYGMTEIEIINPEVRLDTCEMGCTHCVMLVKIIATGEIQEIFADQVEWE